MKLTRVYQELDAAYPYDMQVIQSIVHIAIMMLYMYNCIIQIHVCIGERRIGEIRATIKMETCPKVTKHDFDTGLT